MVLHKTSASHDLNSIDCGRFGDSSGLELGRLGIASQGLKLNASIPISGCAPHKEANAVQLHGHFSNHKGNALIRDDRTPKGDTLFRVFASIFKRGASSATGNART